MFISLFTHQTPPGLDSVIQRDSCKGQIYKKDDSHLILTVIFFNEYLDMANVFFYYGTGVPTTATPTHVKTRLSLTAPEETHIGWP